MGSVVIDLPWPSSKLSSNYFGHWRPKATAAKKSRNDARILALQAKIGCWPNAVLMFVYFPPDNRRRDVQNMPAMLKASIDGIADAMGCDDHGFRPRFPDHFGRTSKGGYVRVCISEDVTKATETKPYNGFIAK